MQHAGVSCGFAVVIAGRKVDAARTFVNHADHARPAAEYEQLIRQCVLIARGYIAPAMEWRCSGEAGKRGVGRQGRGLLKNAEREAVAESAAASRKHSRRPRSLCVCHGASLRRLCDPAAGSAEGHGSVSSRCCQLPPPATYCRRVGWRVHVAGRRLLVARHCVCHNITLTREFRD